MMHRHSKISTKQSHPCGAGVMVAITLTSIVMVQCGGGGASVSASAAPAQALSISPASSSVFLGQCVLFEANGVDAHDSTLVWSAGGVVGGNSAVGTIASTGAAMAIYTAPGVLPAKPEVTISVMTGTGAEEQANSKVSIQSDVRVAIQPATVQLSPGTTQTITASVNSSGNPARGVTWSVNGIDGGNSTIGIIHDQGRGVAIYTAPSVPPSPDTVEIIATSTADATRSAAAIVTIACSQPNGITPPNALVSIGTTQPFTAALCVAPGTTIAWDVDGIAGGNDVVGKIAAVNSTMALYTAPGSLPDGNPVNIHATSLIAESQSALATVQVTPSIAVSVNPPAVSVGLGERVMLTANVQNTSETGVTWAVGGVANGSTQLGEICIPGSDPCAPPAPGAAQSVDYLGPAIFPSGSPVMATATSTEDPTRSGSSSVTLLSSPGTRFTVVPGYAFLAPQGQQGSTVQFTATFDGVPQGGATWSLSSPSVGQCTAATCGAIDANGFYTAPQLTPSPNEIVVTAQSNAQSGLMATASVSLTNGVLISSLLPASATSGIPYGFPLTVLGANFIAGSGEGASSILINGQPRSADCPTSNECAVTLMATDVSTEGVLTVQIQNPGSPGALSNSVPFVLTLLQTAKAEISLNSEAPFAAQQDIEAVDLTTGGSGPDGLTINFAGLLDESDGNINCTLQQSAISIVRPASGTESVSLCVQGNGLDASMNFQFTGPSDIGIISTNLMGQLQNTVELQLTISSTTQPGVRTLMVTTIEQDKAVASGLLEVE